MISILPVTSGPVSTAVGASVRRRKQASSLWLSAALRCVPVNAMLMWRSTLSSWPAARGGDEPLYVAAIRAAVGHGRSRRIAVMLETRLQSRSILLIEPDAFLAAYLGSALAASGSFTVSTCSTYYAAARVLREAIPVAACLSLHLDHGHSWRSAHELRRSGVPFAFTARQPTPDVPATWADVPLLVQPIAAFQVADLLAGLIASDALMSASDGTASLPVSSGDARQRWLFRADLLRGH